MSIVTRAVVTACWRNCRKAPCDAALTAALTCSLAASNVAVFRSRTRMMCQPYWVCTGSEIWPMGSSLAALSNSGTNTPLGLQPRSPPLAPLPVSIETDLATAAKSSPPLIRARAASASALVFTRMWDRQFWLNSSWWAS